MTSRESEPIDVVDEHDRVVGTTDRLTAHRTGLLHRVGAVYVFNGTGELYVQVRRDGGLLDHSVGGHVDRGEDYLTGTLREAEEELGLSQSLTSLSVFHSDEGPEMQHMFGLFACVAEPSWTFAPNEEVEEIVPMRIGEIWTRMQSSPERFTRGFVNTMREYRRLATS